MNSLIPYYIALGVAVFANAGSQLCLKRGMGVIATRGETPLIKAALTNWPLIAGLALAGVLLLSYLFALQKVPLRLAYAGVTIGSLCVIVASGIITGGGISWKPILGVIFAGAALALLS
jgi:hypothetical protein